MMLQLMVMSIRIRLAIGLPTQEVNIIFISS